MPAETPTKNGRVTSARIPVRTTTDDERLRGWALEHRERVHRLKLHIAAFVLGMLVLTPVWALVEYETAGSFERLSSNGQPGDWEPWILYVALVWGLIVAITALEVLFDRPTTDEEIDREIERLTSRS